MGQALDVVSGFVTAPSTTLTGWTMAAGDSLTIRNGSPGKRIMLLSHWAKNKVAGTLVVRSPKMHDNVAGLKTAVLAADVEPLLPIGVGTIMYPVDVLTVQQSGSAVGGAIETGSLLVWYEDLPGASARLIDIPTLAKRQIDLMSTEVPITPGTAGGYSGGAAVNSSNDNFQAGYDYALLGGMVSARCGSVCVRGADTANMRVGFPGEPTKRDVTQRWFTLLSQQFNLPLIPVFASNNKGAITVDVTTDDAGTAVTVDLLFARLTTP